MFCIMFDTSQKFGLRSGPFILSRRSLGLFLSVTHSARGEDGDTDLFLVFFMFVCVVEHVYQDGTFPRRRVAIPLLNFKLRRKLLNRKGFPGQSTNTSTVIGCLSRHKFKGVGGGQ